MANEDFFENFLRQAGNYTGGDLEYYEDTHDANGNYIGQRGQNTGVNYTQPPVSGVGQVMPQSRQQPVSAAALRTEQNLREPTKFAHVPPQKTDPKPRDLPTAEQYISPQLNQNFVIYRPRTTADVERLIAYLRRREPALVDLDPISDSPEAQRLMDFTSGAAYALGDRVMTIRRNLFLITPETIDVLKPESDK